MLVVSPILHAHVNSLTKKKKKKDQPVSHAKNFVNLKNFNFHKKQRAVLIFFYPIRLPFQVSGLGLTIYLSGLAKAFLYSCLGEIHVKSYP